MGELYVIRHGQSEWNHKRLWAGGNSDINLTDVGRQQARDACANLRSLNIQEISSSPLKRAKETASIIAEELNIPLTEPLEDFNERHLGELSGLTSEIIGQRYPGFLEDWREGKPSVVPGGEPWDDFIGRVIRGVNSVVSRSGVFLVVAHMGVLRAIEYLLGIPQNRHDNLTGIWVRQTVTSPTSDPES